MTTVTHPHPSPDSYQDRPSERILYVDDESDARDAFAEAAVKLGFQVDCADGGGAALVKIVQRSYAAVLADLRMPTLNGLSLIKLLRPKWPAISYLLVTGTAQLQLAPEDGLIDEILHKPWTLSQLSHALHRAVTRHRERFERGGKLWLRGPDPILLVEDEGVAGAALGPVLGELSETTERICPDELSYPATIAHIREHYYRAAVIALDLPRERGLEPLEQLQVIKPELPIVMVSGLEDEALMARVMEAGAQDYLPRAEAQAKNLRRAIRYATERKHTQDQLRTLTHHDHLTGLANRALFREELSERLSVVAQRRERLALLYLNLDRFKVVNDSLGHDLGDELLKVVAERLRDNLDHSGRVARLGGDEFAVLVAPVVRDEEVIELAHRLLEALIPPIRLRDYEMSATGSIGIAFYPDHGTDAGELLKRAGRAMCQAKQNGRDGYAVYTNEGEETQSGVLERLRLETGIRHALERNEYVVYYQPQLSWDRRQLMGVEALVRWHHPAQGLLSPGRFMPFLESSGLIKGVGEWVLREACRQVRVWQGDGFENLRVAVNLSARQFEGSDLVDIVESSIRDARIPPDTLELEITESLLMRDTETSRSMLNELKGLGVRIAIDDFGTGYSSLAYLKKFPLDALKIDRSFVRDIESDDDDQAIAGAIVGLGHNLRLDVVAEGVETEEQHRMLEGCDSFQGFLVARPEPASRSAATIRKLRPKIL